MGTHRIPDLVLEIILGQVFRNVHKVHEMYCSEFTPLRWLELTQQMPWLLRADSTRTLRSVPWTVEDLPQSLLTSKVIYMFDDVHYSFAEVESE